MCFVSEAEHEMFEAMMLVDLDWYDAVEIIQFEQDMLDDVDLVTILIGRKRADKLNKLSAWSGMVDEPRKYLASLTDEALERKAKRVVRRRQAARFRLRPCKGSKSVARICRDIKRNDVEKKHAVMSCWYPEDLDEIFDQSDNDEMSLDEQFEEDLRLFERDCAINEFIGNGTDYWYQENDDDEFDDDDYEPDYFYNGPEDPAFTARTEA